jgi:hypothetical protein
MSWNELTRCQQRILIKLFGGGSLRGDDSVETADLIQRGLVTRNGLTASGLEVFKAALKSQYESRRSGNNYHALPRAKATFSLRLLISDGHWPFQFFSAMLSISRCIEAAGP